MDTPDQCRASAAWLGRLVGSGASKDEWRARDHPESGLHPRTLAPLREGVLELAEASAVGGAALSGGISGAQEKSVRHYRGTDSDPAPPAR